MTLKLNIYSNYETAALLRVFSNQTPLWEENIQLRRGENRLTYPLTIAQEGFHHYRAMIEAPKDSVPENNEAAAYTMVKGPARILLAEGKPGEGMAIVSALQSLNLPADVISPGEFRTGLAELKRYALLILCNVPAEELETGVMESIRAGVRDLGMGLIMVGGEDSFGPGGYLHTPVEQALPVHMDLKGKKKIPSLGLMLVIDKSGSMSETSGGVCKVELAKEAAAQAASVLDARDRVGVIAFDDTAQWVVKTQAVRDLDAIQADIGTIRADGGTSIFPALALGYIGIKDVPTKYKHVILLTDGMSSSEGDYFFLARRMQKAGITLSTVAVGKDADTQLLSSLAEWGQGRYYYCDDIRRVPRIFTKESIKARRDYLVEEDFYPVVSEYSSLLQGIDACRLCMDMSASRPKTAAR
ncbi:vWA domain-containing protein [Syntrophomonas palmitatica]|uniref:vWA domain-containing protein n=1 Tax=Syntrophomonas palmitatica TaxID=402877 RepID=UPI0006D1E362|nr:VWA domain-containing protein [Syntrophomonas palmitatica]